MPLTRRQFLRESSVAGAGLALAGASCRPSGLPRHAGEIAFTHGVASGDPLPDRVILWTRLAPTEKSTLDHIDVEWRIARDPSLRDVVATGKTSSEFDSGYTVKVDATGLEPGQDYWYAFASYGQSSVIGQTRSAKDGSPERARFAVASCANYPQGFYNAYRRIAEQPDLDAVLHLGDYIYEYANGTFGDGRALGRVPEPDREIVTLEDYRTRYAQYHSDPDLQELHRRHPMIPVWDDHELANNAWQGGAQNHQTFEGPWSLRRSVAVQAWNEWLPVRTNTNAPNQIWRSFAFGDLVDLAMLDTRLMGRAQQAERGDIETPAKLGRSLLGDEQERWLETHLAESAARGSAWQLLGQQVLVAAITSQGDPGANPDSWSGYEPARQRLIDQMARAERQDVIVATGDIHSSWALELPEDPFDAKSPSAGIELVTPAISSKALGAIVPSYEQTLRARKLPHLKYVDLVNHGYLLLDIDRDRARSEWHFVDTVSKRSDGQRLARAFETPRGTKRLDPA